MSNKYHAVRQEYNGYTYASRREATKAWELDQLKKNWKIKDWKRQVKIPLYGENKTHICDYRVDFLVTHNGGIMEFIEVKSPITATPAWKMKWKLLEDKYKNDTCYIFTVEY